MDSEKKSTLNLLAYYLLINNKLDKAEALYAVLVRFFPEDGQLAMSLAYVFFLSARSEEALEQVNAAVKHIDDPRKPLALLLKARILHQMNRPQEAGRNIERYLRMLDKQREQRDNLSNEKTTT